MKITSRVSPFLAWGDFHARSRFARSTVPEEKWGTTRSLSFSPSFRFFSEKISLPSGGGCIQPIGKDVINNVICDYTVLS